jgi:hypothetical protein
MNIFEFPERVLFIDALDVSGCILDKKKEDIDEVAKQIWEGSYNIFSFLFGNDGCDGVKDILDEWLEEDIYTVIFYMPRTTAKAIRSILNKKMRTNSIIETIESHIESKIRKNIPNLSVFNLNSDNEDLATIFDINLLKRELDKDSKGDFKKIYLIGLRFNLNSSNRLGFYLNNQPIYEESGTIYGDSKILKNKLKRGFITVKSDEGVELEFFNTNKFSSKDYDIGSDLEDLDYQNDSLSFELIESELSKVEMVSKAGEKLVFSLTPIYDNIYDTIDKEKTTTHKLNSNSIYMDSFFIPRDNGLQKVHLLLVNKDGKKIIAGGEYYDGLDLCDIIASITIDLEKETIDVTNRSKIDLTFTNFDNMFWRLDELDLSQDDAIYTSILLDDIPDEYITKPEDINQNNLEVKETIEPNKKFTFHIKEIEFNDTNVSFNEDGVLIRYSFFEIANFKDEFILNRMAYKMSKYGTLIDCFVERPRGRDFKWGGKEYIDHHDILGRVISSKPIYLRSRGDEFNIESRLNSRYYLVQVTTSYQKYILDEGENEITLPNRNRLGMIKIDIINRGYMQRPLVEFSVKVD